MLKGGIVACHTLVQCAVSFACLLCAKAQHSPSGFGEQGSLDLSIYIYDLPARFQNLSSLPTNIQRDYNSAGYGGEKRIPEALKEVGYVTEDASQASFFLVPVWLYAVRYHRSLHLPAGSPLPVERQVLSTTIDYISTHYPFWNASSQGRNHIWVLTNDNGFCGFARGEETFDEIKDSIILTHWGLQATEVHCSVKERLASFNQCPERAQKAGKANHLPCFNPRKDVLIAPTAWEKFEYLPVGNGRHHRRRLQSHLGDQYPVALHQPRRLQADDDFIRLEATSSKKEHTFFFVGALREQAAEYSHGVRQTIAALFNTTPGFYINRKPLSHEELVKEIGRSHFCLAPSGAGWGSRLKLAIKVGCIPVVIQDNVQMPYENVLPYKDFALRLPQHAVHDLQRILEELLQKQPQRVQEMHI
ncbi:hypothetical protein WJX73_001932 [Symbiochloris irregularis]|uniref:Exostosin GT47 domain-containing protein n=1 Tax=Symbiochloris irregularis TaxID=706552 RepID=A0AAW1P9K6_9CHLO